MAASASQEVKSCTKGCNSMQEEKIMMTLTELLLQEKLITANEKLELLKLIKKESLL